MRLPRLLLLTDRTQLPPGRDLVATVARCADAGLTHVVLRELDLPLPARAALADALSGRVAVIAARTRLPGAVGVHLAADQPLPEVVGLRGRSCHWPFEVEHALAARLDYVTLSPVAESASKPGYGPPLGAAGVRRAARHAGPVPVYALGGADPLNAAEMRAAGAHGVAVMGAVMRAADPAAVVTRLLEEVS